MQREIIRPRVNVPILVKLGPDGIDVDGQYGPQVRYYVNDDQGALYVDPPARDAILATGAQGGDEIAICKRSKTRWDVQRVADAAEIPEAARKPVRYMNGSKVGFPASKYAQGVPQIDSPLPVTNGHGQSNGHPVNSTLKVNSYPPVNNGSPTAKHLGECMKLAIDACLIAQDYAHEKNFGLTFLGGDVKSLALSIYINDQEQRGGKR